MAAIEHIFVSADRSGQLLVLRNLDTNRYYYFALHPVLRWDIAASKFERVRGITVGENVRSGKEFWPLFYELSQDLHLKIVSYGLDERQLKVSPSERLPTRLELEQRCAAGHVGGRSREDLREVGTQDVTSQAQNKSGEAVAEQSRTRPEQQYNKTEEHVDLLNAFIFGTEEPTLLGLARALREAIYERKLLSDLRGNPPRSESWGHNGPPRLLRSSSCWPSGIPHHEELFGAMVSVSSQGLMYRSGAAHHPIEGTNKHRNMLRLISQVNGKPDAKDTLYLINLPLSLAEYRMERPTDITHRQYSYAESDPQFSGNMTPRYTFVDLHIGKYGRRRWDIVC